MTFGPSSSLERIGVSCFENSGVEEVSVPNGVRELCDGCFKGCWRLRRVTFGPSSSLERVGSLCFCKCGLVKFEIPVSVRAIGGGAFSECALLGGIVCRDDCRFRAIDGLLLSGDCSRCFCSYGVLSLVCIPDSVRELCDGCFKGCSSLSRVTFSPSSSLERMGVSCFESSGVEDVFVPDGVRELCDGCFRGCWRLRHVTFGPSSLLERIGAEAFGVGRGPGGVSTTCCIVEINLPDGVRELCDGCFKGCRMLRRVTFGSFSSLERIGFHAFPRSVSSFA